MSHHAPDTEAGRRLLGQLDGRPGPVSVRDIRAIEAEVAARDVSDIIGQAVHELTTSLNHRLAHPVGLDEDCRVLGRVIAGRLR